MDDSSSQDEFANEMNEDNANLNIDENESKNKLLLFNFISSIIGEEIIPFPLRFVFYVIESLQMLSLAFYSEMIPIWKNTSVSSQIGSFFSYFTIVDHLSSLTYNHILVVLYVLVGFLIFMVLICLIINIMLINVNRHNLETSHIIFIIFRIFIELIQIIYLPMIELFFFLFKCKDNGNGIIFHEVFTDVMCFSGTNLVHIFVSILAIIIFVFASLFLIKFCYEIRTKSHSWISKSSSEGDIMFLVQKLCLVIIFTFFANSSLNIIIIFVYCISGLILYSMVRRNIYYYNPYIYKVISGQHFLTFWTGLILLLSKVLEGTNFKGQLFLWVFGIIIIAILQLLSDDFRLDLLLLNSFKFDNEKQAFLYFHYLNYLLHQTLRNRKIAFLFDCLVEHHKTYCVKEDCPTRKKFTKTKHLGKIFKEDYEDENLIMIVHFVENSYSFAIEKFHNSIMLKIQYALFIFERLGLKQQALQELFLLENAKLSLEQDFIIYRLKKFIEEDIMNVHQGTSKSSNYDVIDELAYQNLEKRLKINIEKSASFHLEFWSLLSEDNPDLRRLCEIATKINNLNNYIELDWTKISKLNIASICRLISKFLHYIIQDTDEATAIMDKLRLSNLQANRAHIMESQLSEISNDSNCHIIISAQETSFAQITNCNLAAASCLGYTKNEIINCKINILIPQIYSKHHDSFVESFVNNLETKSKLSERLVMAKNKMNYLVPIYLQIKHLPSISNNLQFMATYRKEKAYRYYAYIIIDNTDGILLNLSASCIALLGIDEKKIGRNDLKITDIIPNFFDNSKQMASKSGALLEVYTFFQENLVESESMLISSSEINFKGIGFQGHLVRIEKPSQMTLNASLIKSGNIPSSQLLAPDTQDNKKSSKLEKTEISTHLLNPHNIDEKKMNSNNMAFSLKYDIGNEIYVGEILENANKYYDYMLTDRSKLQLESTRNFQISSRIEESILPPQSDENSRRNQMVLLTDDGKIPENFLESSHRFNQQLSSKRDNALNESNLLKKFELKHREEDIKVSGENIHENKEKIEYGTGIRILQLYGNRLYDLDDLKKEMERSSEEDSKDNEEVAGDKKAEGNQVEKVNVNEEEDEEEYDDNSSFFKSRKRFKNLIGHANSKRFLPNIKLNITGIVLVISLGIIGIVFEVYNLQGISNIKNSYQLIKASSQRLFLSQEVLNRVFELYLLNLGVLTNTPANYETEVRSKLDETIKLLSQYHNYIIFNSFGFSAQHTSLMYSKSTNIVFLDGDKQSSQNFDINDATNQIIGKAYLVEKDDLASMNMQNPNVFFVIYNLLNGCYKSAKNSLKLFIGDLVGMINDSQQILVYSIVISVLLLFIGLIVLIYFYIRISQHENHILSIFLEIPIPKAKLLFLKCEAFLTQLQQGNEDDDLLESENLSDHSSDNGETLLDSSNKKNNNKKRKKIKISYVGLKAFVFKVLLLVGACEGFFIMKYYFYKDIFDNQLSIQSEINSTLFANAMCGILVNAIRQNLLDPTVLIENQTASSAIEVQLQQLSDVFTNLKREHSINLNIHTTEYIDMFNRVMLQNSCILIAASGKVPYYPCPQIVLGGLQQGFELVITYFSDQAQKMYYASENIISNASISFNDLLQYDIKIVNKTKSGSTNQQYISDNVINSQTMKELNDLFDTHFRVLIDDLSDSFVLGIENLVNSQSSLFIIVLIIFLIFIFVVYVLFYFKLVNYLSVKISKTRTFLLIIPIETIQSSNKIMELLIRLLKK